MDILSEIVFKGGTIILSLHKKYKKNNNYYRNRSKNIKYNNKVFLYDFIFKIFKFIIIIGISFVILYPLMVKLSSSFMTTKDIFDPTIKWIPQQIAWTNYLIAFRSLNYIETFTNSFLLVFLVSITQLISCTLVGYSLARFNYPGKKIIFSLVMLVLIVPPQMILLPLYLNLRNFLSGIIPGEGINLIGSFYPFFLTSVTASGFRNSLYIFIMRQCFKGMPDNLEEAAYVDGSGFYSTFFKIMLPHAGPSLVTVFLFSFVWQWNDTFYSSIFLHGNTQGLLPFALYNLPSYYVERVSYFPDRQFITILNNTGIVLFIAPLLIIFGIMQRYFIESIERTGIVG